jgi:hypothetical protein
MGKSKSRKRFFTFVDIGASSAAIRNRSLTAGVGKNPLRVLTLENSQMENNIRSLVEGFVNQIVAAIEADSVRRVQQAVTSAFAGSAAPAGRRGRPSLASAAAAPAVSAKRRPKQFCPVPGCTGIAAPVFGMVCAKHKDMAKSKIKEYRAQRKAAKAGKK